MPTRSEIQELILVSKNAAQDTVRRSYLKDLSDYTKRDTILYASAFSSKRLPNLPGFLISITPDDVQGFMAALHGLKGKELDLILHSPGGSLEAADQIVQYLRSKYTHIRAIVPQNAMSAATMIACACDSIVMGKHSALGPIDPQVTVPFQQGYFTSAAQAILDEFDLAKAEIAANQSSIPIWVTKMQSYPPGLLQLCKTSVQLAIEKVAEWMSTYMFRGQANADETAARIANWLGDANAHKTHGRPIVASALASKGMVIEALEADQDLQEKVLSVFHAAAVTLEITNCMKFVENQNGKGWYINADIRQQ